MHITADLHIHSKYSRGCSKDITFKNLEKFARMKGLDLMGTGDFQHPKWFEEIKQLKEKDGFFYTDTGYPFVLQTEIALVYTDLGKGRRVHLIVLCPDILTAEKITEYLLKKGRIDYDGRPIFKITCEQFVKDLMEMNTDIEIIPAHIWTPWFSLFGSKSGYDTLQECFKEQTKHIHAIETGLSSDPEMNWKLSQLNNIAIISNSDSHSAYPWRIGREATVYDMEEMSYKSLIDAIRGNKIVETIEYYPEEGKYHYDGHRACKVCMSPIESKKVGYICPVCKKEMTIGVATRIEELADQTRTGKPFKRLIPLSEIIAHALGTNVISKKVWEEYYKLIKIFGNELKVLNANEEELAKHTSIAKYIVKARNAEWQPGYDGEYGKPILE